MRLNKLNDQFSLCAPAEASVQCRGSLPLPLPWYAQSHLLKGMDNMPRGGLFGMGPYVPPFRFRKRLCVRGVPTCAALSMRVRGAGWAVGKRTGNCSPRLQWGLWCAGRGNNAGCCGGFGALAEATTLAVVGAVVQP